MYIFRESSPYDLKEVLELYDNSTIRTSVKDFSGFHVCRKKGFADGKVSKEVHLEGAKYFAFNTKELYDPEFLDVFEVMKGNPTLCVNVVTSRSHVWQHLTPILLLGRENFKEDFMGRVYFDHKGIKLYNTKVISDMAGRIASSKYACVYEFYNAENYGQLQVFNYEARIRLLEDAQISPSLGTPPACVGGVFALNAGTPAPTEDSISKSMKLYLGKNKMPQKEDFGGSK